MKIPDDEKLDALLRNAARDALPDEWARKAARGLEGRVLQRITQQVSWKEAAFVLSSWRPLAAAAFAVLIISVWSGRGAVDVFNDDWLTTRAVQDPDTGAGATEFDDIDF